MRAPLLISSLPIETRSFPEEPKDRVFVNSLRPARQDIRMLPCQTPSTGGSGRLLHAAALLFHAACAASAHNNL